MLGIGRVDEFGRFGAQKICIGLFIYPAGTIIAQGVGQDHLSKAQIIKGVIYDRHHRLGHQAPAPKFPAQPKTTVFRFTRAPKIDGANDFVRAAAQRDPTAPIVKEITANRMTPAQIAEGQKLSGELWEKYVLTFQ